MVTLLKRLTLPSVITWVVPFLASFAFYDRNGTMVGNFWVFKGTMVVVAGITAFLAFRKAMNASPTLAVPPASAIVIGIQVLLDLAVLVIGLDMPMREYLLTVVPVYLVVIPAMLFLLSRSRPNPAS
jgi:hypothetical protein